MICSIAELAPLLDKDLQCCTEFEIFAETSGQSRDCLDQSKSTPWSAPNRGLELSEFSYCNATLCVCRLQFVFHSPLISALDLIDRGNVTLLTSPSGRQVFRVSLTDWLSFATFKYIFFSEFCPAFCFSFTAWCIVITFSGELPANLVHLHNSIIHSILICNSISWQAATV